MSAVLGRTQNFDQTVARVNHFRKRQTSYNFRFRNVSHVRVFFYQINPFEIIYRFCISYKMFAPNFEFPYQKLSNLNFHRLFWA